MPKDCLKLETLEDEGGPGREYLTKENFFSQNLDGGKL